MAGPGPASTEKDTQPAASSAATKASPERGGDSGTKAALKSNGLEGAGSAKQGAAFVPGGPIEKSREPGQDKNLAANVEKHVQAFEGAVQCAVDSRGGIRGNIDAKTLMAKAGSVASWVKIAYQQAGKVNALIATTDRRNPPPELKDALGRFTKSGNTLVQKVGNARLPAFDMSVHMELYAQGKHGDVMELLKSWGGPINDISELTLYGSAANAIVDSLASFELQKIIAENKAKREKEVTPKPADQAAAGAGGGEGAAKTKAAPEPKKDRESSKATSDEIRTSIDAQRPDHDPNQLDDDYSFKLIPAGRGLVTITMRYHRGGRVVSDRIASNVDVAAANDSPAKLNKWHQDTSKRLKDSGAKFSETLLKKAFDDKLSMDIAVEAVANEQHGPRKPKK